METTPKADMRGVQFLDGIYSKRTGDLCERCGNYNHCDDSSANDVLGIELVVSRCERFSPILLFVNPAGTEEEFTTIRLGEAWSKRVLPGSVVTLTDKATVYGKAEVTHVRTGSKENMIIESIWTNHLMLEFQGTVEERIERMTKIVRNSYGNLIWKNNRKATILHLRRRE